MSDNMFGYDPRLPEEIRDMFVALCYDVAFLQHKWNFYLELFSEEENTALLSDLARASFHIIEESLRHDMTMSICRLSDPPETGKYKNLSLRTLVQRCNGIADVDTLKDDFLDACEPVRKLRDKLVAHNDLQTRIEPQANPFPGIERSQIDRIILLASQILNTIYGQFVDGELDFNPIAMGGANALIHLLKLAKEAQQAKRQKML